MRSAQRPWSITGCALLSWTGRQLLGGRATFQSYSLALPSWIFAA